MFIKIAATIFQMQLQNKIQYSERERGKVRVIEETNQKTLVGNLLRKEVNINS